MSTKVVLAFVVGTMVAGAGTGSGMSPRAEEPGAVRFLRDYRCMMITESLFERPSAVRPHLLLR